MIDYKLFYKKLDELKNLVDKMTPDELESFQKNMSYHIFKCNLPRVYKDMLIKALYKRKV